MLQQDPRYKTGIPLRDDDVNLDSPTGSNQTGTGCPTEPPSAVKKGETERKKEKKVESKKPVAKQPKKAEKKKEEEKEEPKADPKVAASRKRYRLLLYISLAVYVVCMAVFLFVGSHRWFGLTAVSAFA